MHLPIKINEITAFLGVSQQYLYKICKTRLSVSPKRYIVDRKLFYAKKLLKESAMSITEIANSLGFEDVLTFSKFFSSHEKKSPQRFRNT